MKRLYSRKESEIYANECDRLLVNSRFLNSQSGTFPGPNTLFGDESSLRFYLLELVGDKDGYYLRSGERRIAKKPYLEMKLAMVDEQFQIYQELKKETGFEKPTEMPEQMMEEFYLLKARWTVTNAEEAEIRKRLTVFENQKKVQDDSAVLVHGLRGFAKAHGTKATNPQLINRLAIIDGQKVEMASDGLLIIKDDRSPYDGMLVSDYRKLCYEWQLQEQLKEIEEFQKLQKQCQAEGKTIPQAMPVRAMRTVSKSSLPKWPEWAKNYLKNEKVSK